MSTASPVRNLSDTLILVDSPRVFVRITSVLMSPIRCQFSVHVHRQSDD
ncbi:hypothetical protein IEU95_15980 [Hoyosella rhizosphaerae]|nr:hypothetical protein [Hoyosella rhizosphaerae]MBN4928334.1 hypothetical protein [Hoyosella rhizosphaerae]